MIYHKWCTCITRPGSHSMAAQKEKKRTENLLLLELELFPVSLVSNSLLCGQKHYIYIPHRLRRLSTQMCTKNNHYLRDSCGCRCRCEWRYLFLRCWNTMTCQLAIFHTPNTRHLVLMPFHNEFIVAADYYSNFGIQLANTLRCVELERIKLHYRSGYWVSYNPFFGQNDQNHLMMRCYRSTKWQKRTQNITGNVFILAQHPLDALIIHLKWLLCNIRRFLFAIKDVTTE